MRNILILGAVRTPIGVMGGAFIGTSAVQLGISVATETRRRSGVSPKQIDEAIFGCVLTAGQAQNPARQIALGAGIPQETPSFTVNKVCGSGLKAIELDWQALALERAIESVAVYRDIYLRLFPDDKREEHYRLWRDARLLYLGCTMSIVREAAFLFDQEFGGDSLLRFFDETTAQ
ncbi:MAG: hypothetical protein GWP08_09415 [Nitrospiraceae bacterium]|nr:hypothetical protein [Nitrospiraceae bacterium]